MKNKYFIPLVICILIGIYFLSRCTSDDIKEDGYINTPQPGNWKRLYEREHRDSIVKGLIIPNDSIIPIVTLDKP